jgi:hypothetical protein
MEGRMTRKKLGQWTTGETNPIYNKVRPQRIPSILLVEATQSLNGILIHLIHRKSRKNETDNDIKKQKNGNFNVGRENSSNVMPIINEKSNYTESQGVPKKVKDLPKK